jgi:hemoglobin
MFQAMDEQGIEPGLRARLEKSLFDTADWMRNRPD